MIAWATKSVPSSIAVPSNVAVLYAVAEEEVPTMVLNTAEEVEHPYRRRLTPLGPGKSLNCPPATSRTAGALQAAVREPGICR